MDEWHIELINVDDLAELLPAVTSEKVYEKRNLHRFCKDGLFSEAIFGPTKTATCGCNIYWGRSKIGTRCPVCNVEITYSSSRFDKLAKIQLPFAIFNPLFYILIRRFSAKIAKLLDFLLLDNKLNVICQKNGEYFVLKDIKNHADLQNIVNVSQEHGINCYTGLDGACDFVIDLAKRYAPQKVLWSFILDNKDRLKIHNVIVIPAAYRGIVFNDQNQQIRDEVNKYYLHILNFIKMYQANSILKKVNACSIQYQKHLFRYILEYYMYVFRTLASKNGVIRGYILGKRVDFSGRAVICPDASLSLGECGVSFFILLELYKIEIAKELLNRKQFVFLHEAIQYLEDILATRTYIPEKHDELFSVVNQVCSNEYVILNRQPSLHRMNLLAFKVKCIHEPIIRIHPMICEIYNADFDGDQMAIYRPISVEALQEYQTIMSIEYNLISPSTFDLILGINQDIILGIYYLTKEGYTPTVTINGIETTQGRVFFNMLLPYISSERDINKNNFINKTITKKELISICNKIAKIFKDRTDLVCQTMDNIKKWGFYFSTVLGNTMSLDKMYVPELYHIREEILLSDKKVNQKVSDLYKPNVLNIIKQSFPYTDIIESGSRGKWEQAYQIFFTRGYVSNFKGNIIETPILHNLLEGLTPDEFFISCYGTRKGLLDTACNTAESGHLTRKLIFTLSHAIVDPNLDDCGSKHTLNLHVDNETIGNSLLYRWYVNENNELQQIEPQNVQELVGKHIQLRSPIFCKSKHYCRKCVGYIDQFHTPYLGFISAQALGETATQLVLRTFHTSGAASSREEDDEDNKQADVTADLNILRKLLHLSLPVKYKGKTYQQLDYDTLLSIIRDIYQQYKNILHLHYEILVSEMMYTPKGELWRTSGQNHKYKLVSIELIPRFKNSLLAICYNKVSYNIFLNLLTHEKISLEDMGIFEKIITNNNFTS